MGFGTPIKSWSCYVENGGCTQFALGESAKLNEINVTTIIIQRLRKQRMKEESAKLFFNYFLLGSLGVPRV